MYATLVTLLLVIATVVSPANAALTPFDVEYDCAAMNVRQYLASVSTIVERGYPELYEVFTQLLDETDEAITTGNLTYSSYYRSLKTLYDSTNDKTLPNKVHRATSKRSNTRAIESAPMEATDVIFDTFEALALHESPELQQLVRDERAATEQRVMSRVSMPSIVFHLELFYQRVRQHDATFLDQATAVYNDLNERSFAEYLVVV